MLTDSLFIGRARELETLNLALRDVDNNAGRFIAVVGEAGMGKTRLIAETAETAKTHGKQVLWSQVIEEPGAPPYFCWMLALRACLQQCDNDQLSADLGSGASTVAHIIPELRDRLDLPPGQALVDSAAARYQLFDSVTRFLLNVARRGPLVILLDNLHLADRSSLALLEYFCQQLANHPVLVVGAYRDSELHRRHPLRPVLNRLSRSAGFSRLVLAGLSREEIAELLYIHLGDPPPTQMVAAVHEQSGGNPLFVTEVGGMLAQQMQQDKLPGTGFHFQIPESLRDVITARLDTLPGETSNLLSIAAVLGNEFDRALLTDLSGRHTETVAQALQNAETAGVIGPLGQDRFHFHHVLFREVLYAEHNTLSRVMFHRKAGELIENRHRSELRPHVSQLAYHFFEAAQAGREDKAIIYCRQAAETAVAQRAYGEAAALFDCALQAAELEAEPDLENRFELLLAMGQAEYHSGQLTTGTKTLMKSAVLAFQHHWWRRLAEALFVFELVCQQSGFRHVASVPLHQAVLEHLPEDYQALRARTLSSLAKAYRKAGEPTLATATFHEGVQLARKCGDPVVLLDCLRKGNWTVGRSPAAMREGLDISREVLALARSQGAADPVLDALVDIVFQLCDLGEIEETRHTLVELRGLAQEQRQPHFLNVLVGFETAVAILQGHWSEALSHARETMRQVPLQGVLGLEGRFAFQMFAIKKAQGSLGEVAELAGRIIGAGNGNQFWLPGQILLHCELGQQRQAREALEQLGDPRNLPEDDLRVIALVYLAEACVSLRDRPRCALIYELLEPYRGLNATLAGTLMLGAVSGFLALLASAMRRYGEAAALFEEALVMNRDMGAWPALARSEVDFAHLLFQGENQAKNVRAHKLLMEAQSIARQYGLQPVLDTIESMRDKVSADSLTLRELDVLKQIASGSSNRSIANSLHISHSTVATHIRNIFRKTGVTNRTEAVGFARDADLLGRE